MPTYHLYGIRNGSPVETADVETETVEEAMLLARAGFSSDTIEIWSADRRLRILPRTGLAPTRTGNHGGRSTAGLRPASIRGH